VFRGKASDWDLAGEKGVKTLRQKDHGAGKDLSLISKGLLKGKRLLEAPEKRTSKGLQFRTGLQL